MGKEDSNVAVLSLTSFAIDITFSSWWMILPLYLERLGASVTEVGLCYALIGLAWALSQLPGGVFSDRFGRKRVILISTLTFTPFYTSMLFLKEWASVTIAVTLSSFFAGLQNPSFSSMIAESSRRFGLARAFGFYNFLMNLGWAVGPLIGAFAIPSLGFDPIFVIGAIVTTVCLLIRAVLLSEPPASSERVRTSLKMLFLPITLSILIFQLANGLISPLIPLYAEKLMGFGVSEIQLMFFAAQLLASLSSLIAGLFVARIGGLKSLIVSFIFSGVFSLTWVFSSSYAAFIVLSLYYTFLFAFTEVAFSTLLSELTARESRATVFGVSTVISGLSHSAGSYIGGVVWEALHPVVPFLLAFTLMLAAPLPLLKKRF
ncbi:MAG: MFS transporter [Candidatus Korarchaeum sp.]|nr:MFS transporter [Candidatus Korarchaeum sp.]MDW8036124.1 MFS transporter [Candidatus Korarchaeum sp.]